MDIKKERNYESEVPERPKATSLAGPDKALAFIMGLIALVMFLQVFFRYVLNNSLTWTEEITRFLFIWLVFLGTVINIRDRWNIGVDVLATMLPKFYTRHLQLLDVLLVLAFLIFLVVSGFVWVYLSRGSYSSAVGLPYNLVLYGALPLTSVLGCYYCFANLKKLKKAEGEEQDA